MNFFAFNQFLAHSRLKTNHSCTKAVSITLSMLMVPPVTSGSAALTWLSLTSVLGPRADF